MGSADAPRPWPPRGREWTVLVAGCGLIGGSIARAVRVHWPRARIAVLDRAPVVRQARRAHVAEEGAPLGKLTAVVRELRPTVVVLALPVDVILACLPDLTRAVMQLPARARPLVLDVGSVKQPIVQAAKELGLPHFVGGHPMVGRERGGFMAASAELLRARSFALCPIPRRPASDVRKAAGFARALGGRPIVLPAPVHDECVALTSHVPHILATTLMHMASSWRPSGSRGAGRDLPWSLAAGSWRDATRVAASDPGLWEPIFHHNRTAVVSTLEAWIDLLQAVCAALGRPRGTLDGAGIDAAAMARLRRRIEPFLTDEPSPGLQAPGGVRHAIDGFERGRGRA